MPAEICSLSSHPLTLETNLHVCPSLKVDILVLGEKKARAAIIEEGGANRNSLYTGSLQPHWASLCSMAARYWLITLGLLLVVTSAAAEPECVYRGGGGRLRPILHPSASVAARRQVDRRRHRPYLLFLH